MKRISAQQAVAGLNNYAGAGSTRKGRTSGVLQPKGGRLTGNNKRIICIYDTTTEEEEEDEGSAGGSPSPGAAAGRSTRVASSSDQDQASIQATPIDNGNFTGAASPKEHAGFQQPGDEGAEQQGATGRGEGNTGDIHERILRRLDEMKALILTQLQGQTQLVCSTCKRRAKNFQLLSSTSGANLENAANSEVVLLTDIPQLNLASTVMQQQRQQDMQSTTPSKDQEQAKSATTASASSAKQAKSAGKQPTAKGGFKQPLKGAKRPQSGNRTGTSISKSTGNSRRQSSHTRDSAGAGKSVVPGVNSNAQTTLPEPTQTVGATLDAAAEPAVPAPGATPAKKPGMRGRKKIILVKRRRPGAQKKNAADGGSATLVDPQQQQPQQQQPQAPTTTSRAIARNRRIQKKKTATQAAAAAAAAASSTGNNANNDTGATAAKKITRSTVQQFITKLQSALDDEPLAS